MNEMYASAVTRGIFSGLIKVEYTSRQANMGFLVSPPFRRPIEGTSHPTSEFLVRCRERILYVQYERMASLKF